MQSRKIDNELKVLLKEGVRWENLKHFIKSSRRR